MLFLKHDRLCSKDGRLAEPSLLVPPFFGFPLLVSVALRRAFEITRSLPPKLLFTIYENEPMI